MMATRPFARHDRDYLNKRVQERGSRFRVKATICGKPAWMVAEERKKEPSK